MKDDSFRISAPMLFLTSNGALNRIKCKGKIVAVPLSVKLRQKRVNLRNGAGKMKVTTLRHAC
jgi:SH3-like domain-containing protein